MRIALLIMGTARSDYARRCMASLDDSQFCGVLHHDDVEPRQGLAASVQLCWDELRSWDLDYVFHVEEDFVFPDPPPIDDMAAILAANPELAQVALYRQPWSPEEIAADGYLNLHSDQYEQREGYLVTDRLFTLNPCLYPAWLMDIGWPDRGGEAEFTAICREKGLRFGLYGQRTDSARCIHIGARRSAGWTL